MPTAHDSSNAKVTRHRERMRAAGYRPVQIWALDTRSSELADTLRRQCLGLRGDSAEAQAMDCSEAAVRLIQGWKA